MNENGLMLAFQFLDHNTYSAKKMSPSEYGKYIKFWMIKIPYLDSDDLDYSKLEYIDPTFDTCTEEDLKGLNTIVDRYYCPDEKTKKLKSLKNEKGVRNAIVVNVFRCEFTNPECE